MRTSSAALKINTALTGQRNVNKTSTMGTHGSFIFRGYNGYNPYIGGLKPSFFMVLGSKGNRWLVGFTNHQLGLELCFFACWRKTLHFFALVLGGGFYIWWVISCQRMPLNKIVHFPICWSKSDKTYWNMLKPPNIKTLTKKKGRTSSFLVGWHCRHWEKEYSTVKSGKRCGNHAFANMWMHWKQGWYVDYQILTDNIKDIAHFNRNPSNPPVFVWKDFILEGFKPKAAEKQL